MSVQTGGGTYVFLRKHCSSYGYIWHKERKILWTSAPFSAVWSICPGHPMDNKDLNLLQADSEAPIRLYRCLGCLFAKPLSVHSFSAKFQMIFVVCFFFFFFSFSKLSLGKKFVCKIERLNISECRSRWDWSLWAISTGSMLFAKALYYSLWQWKSKITKQKSSRHSKISFWEN